MFTMKQTDLCNFLLLQNSLLNDNPENGNCPKNYFELKRVIPAFQSLVELKRIFLLYVQIAQILHLK